jgi:ribonuclease HII
MRYGALLDATIPLARTHIVAEESVRSEYLVEEHQGPRWMRVVFQERAECVSFPVALASCLAKYARETWMEGFNAYFASLQSGLLPTAGYVTDARRWLEEAGPALALCGLERTALVRER